MNYAPVLVPGSQLSTLNSQLSTLVSTPLHPNYCSSAKIAVELRNNGRCTHQNGGTIRWFMFPMVGAFHVWLIFKLDTS